MAQSSAYAFLLNMWIMKRIDQATLQQKVTNNKITQDEYNQIINTPQVQ